MTDELKKEFEETLEKIEKEAAFRELKMKMEYLQAWKKAHPRPKHKNKKE